MGTRTPVQRGAQKTAQKSRLSNNNTSNVNTDANNNNNNNNKNKKEIGNRVARGAKSGNQLYDITSKSVDLFVYLTANICALYYMI